MVCQGYAALRVRGYEFQQHEKSARVLGDQQCWDDEGVPLQIQPHDGFPLECLASSGIGEELVSKRLEGADLACLAAINEENDAEPALAKGAENLKLTRYQVVHVS
jgi:hypothetical protein